MRFKKQITVLCIVAALLLIGACGMSIWRGRSRTFEIPAGEKPVTNPMKGFMAWGENFREDPWVSFAYIPVYWNLLEPSEGVYDFEALEERACFQKWKDANVRLVLRVVADSPSQEAHMDIPSWLYEKMGKDAGQAYDNSYGKGFSPNYRSPVFQKAHAGLIRALGERYAEDPAVAFVQLGSLGHWGEWHVNVSEGIERFPFQSVTDRYVQDYLEHFPAEKLLLRRPYKIGAENKMGLYNDSFGKVSSHESWLSWVKDGYESDQNGEQLSGMPNFWKYAPSGGELATDQEESRYFSDEQFPALLKLLRESHTTFLGPNAPKFQEHEGTTKKNIEQFLQEMGYCLGVRRCRIRRGIFDKTIQAELTWSNRGIAPLYGDWPVYVELRDESGAVVWKHSYSSRLSSLVSGEAVQNLSLEGTENLKKGAYQCYVGIIDPLTAKPGVRLDMEGEGMTYWMADITIY